MHASARVWFPKSTIILTNHLIYHHQSVINQSYSYSLNPTQSVLFSLRHTHSTSMSYSLFKLASVYSPICVWIIPDCQSVSSNLFLYQVLLAFEIGQGWNRWNSSHLKQVKFETGETGHNLKQVETVTQLNFETAFSHLFQNPRVLLTCNICFFRNNSEWMMQLNWMKYFQL